VLNATITLVLFIKDTLTHRLSHRVGTATMEQWATSSNAALRITLLDAPNLKSNTFHPTFTYPIFGEAETIYGYSNLQLPLQLKSDTLLASLDVKYDKKLESKTAKIDDPRASLMQFLPDSDVSGNSEELESKAESSSREQPFKPYGQLVHTYAREKEGAKGKGKGRAGAVRPTVEVDDPNARRFEVYHCSWDTPGFKEYHRRMQIFTLLFIEGASYIQEDEHNWEFVVVYEVSQDTESRTKYHFVGYTSLYNFWFYPNFTRIRLSQFVVLPPYQSQGHGAELYNQVVKLALERDSVSELTIEDPSEAFDKLRDTNDIKRLLSPSDGFLKRAKEHVKGGALRAPVAKDWSEMERKVHKIAKRQWDRLIEMTQLMMLDEEDVEQVKNYRLQVSSG
jgi:histone acetyltransferase 1